MRMREFNKDFDQGLISSGPDLTFEAWDSSGYLPLLFVTEQRP